MFVGQHNHTLDAKKRLVIPAKFRHSSLLAPDENNNKGVFVTFDSRNYQNSSISLMILYPSGIWAKKLEWLEENALKSEEAAWYLRKVSADTEFCKIDDQWRVLVPQRFVKATDLKRDIMIVGAGSQIEIWDVERWNQVYEWLRNQSVNFSRYVYKNSP